MDQTSIKPVIDYLALFIQGLGQFSGVFLGVVAGTIVTILVQKWKAKRDEANQFLNFKIELDINRKKIESWLEELNKYRNAVNGDSLLTYFGYFKLSSFIGAMAFQLHSTGIIYKYLSHEHFVQLQEIYSDFSIPGENYLNNQIEQRKQSLVSLNERGLQDEWHSWLKQRVVKDIDFWEDKMKRHLITLNNISEKNQ